MQCHVYIIMAELKVCKNDVPTALLGAAGGIIRGGGEPSK